VFSQEEGFHTTDILPPPLLLITAIARGAADVANHATIITKHFSKHVGHATFARLEDKQVFFSLHTNVYI